MHTADHCLSKIAEFEEKAERASSTYDRNAFRQLAARWRKLLELLDNGRFETE
jgi:hypothetical protein